MGSNTTNAYGNITINDKSIALVAGHCALECYGVVDLVPRNLWENIKELFIKTYNYARGVKITAVDNRITVDIFLILKYGVSVGAVAKSLKDSVKYNVEDFTGMIVDNVNVHVVGIHI